MVAVLSWRRLPSLACSLLVPLAVTAHAAAEPVARRVSMATTASSPAKSQGVLERIPTASWAMGCAAGAALAAHAVYEAVSDRRRTRLADRCAGDCPDFRIDHYQESRERADVALRLSVLAAASAVWLAYNDPQEALDRLGRRQPPRRDAGFKVKVKPANRGVWASVVVYF